jgi:hypothetical protein
MSSLAGIKKEAAETAITPPVHLEFIQNQAGITEADGLAEIEAYHRALFLHHHAADLEKFRQQARIHEDRLGHLEARLGQARARLGGLEKTIPVNLDGGPDVRPNLPWNAWDVAMFISAALGILALLVFGVLNVSFNLLESGLVTFTENPVRAYFWAALLPVGALGVKVGWDFLQNRRVRAVYLWLCLGLGILGVLAWIAAYASVYPSLSKSVSENIQSLSVFDKAGSGLLGGQSAGGAKWIDMITVAAQAVAEVFVSAVLGMYLTTLYGKHLRVRLAGNPLFTQLDDERRELEEDIARERLALASAHGEECKLQNQLEALVAYAKSIFHKESENRRDESRHKKALLDEISAQLRAQLETIAPAASGSRANGSPTAITGGNGR